MSQLVRSVATALKEKFGFSKYIFFHKLVFCTEFKQVESKETKEWYAANLGLEMNEWGAVSFDSRDIGNPDQINTLQWSLFKKGTDYLEPSKKEFMINYRVQHIEALVEKLRANGVTIVDEIATYDFGKFIHIMDADGNKIELWEPC